MTMHNYACIKCKTPYDSDELEAYYCESCLAEKQAIAAEIDKKIASRPSKRQAPSFEERMGQYQTIKGIAMINLPKHGNNQENS